MLASRCGELTCSPVYCGDGVESVPELNRPGFLGQRLAIAGQIHPAFERHVRSHFIVVAAPSLDLTFFLLLTKAGDSGNRFDER